MQLQLQLAPFPQRNQISKPWQRRIASAAIAANSVMACLRLKVNLFWRNQSYRSSEVKIRCGTLSRPNFHQRQIEIVLFKRWTSWKTLWRNNPFLVQKCCSALHISNKQPIAAVSSLLCMRLRTWFSVVAIAACRAFLDIPGFILHSCHFHRTKM